MQVAGNLDVADEAGVELRLRPCGAVVGVSDIECAAPDVEVIVGNVHPPVEGAGRVVVHPHRLAVVAAAVVRAGAGGPSDAVGRGPHANALAAAAGRQVAREPDAQARIVHHDGVAVVGAVAGAEGLARLPCGSVIGRVGETGVAAAGSAAVVVVDDPGIVRSAPFHALRLSHLGICAVRKHNIYVGAADEQRRGQQVLNPLGEPVTGELAALGR
ncbi:MAG: hypothetical protein DMF11_03520 [Verrucomicrobia bacterium]|nr:MAG: hypothetical protein DMF11_03520 [Verrucomicrobiota bacterium]